MAGEYAGGSGKDDSKIDYSKTATSIVFGYDMGRNNIWAGYGFSDSLTSKTTFGDLTTSGTNFKIGYGSQFPNKVAINLELIIPTYTKTKLGAIEGNVKDVYSKYNTTTLLLSVSYLFGDAK